MRSPSDNPASTIAKKPSLLPSVTGRSTIAPCASCVRTYAPCSPYCTACIGITMPRSSLTPTFATALNPSCSVTPSGTVTMMVTSNVTTPCSFRDVELMPVIMPSQLLVRQGVDRYRDGRFSPQGQDINLIHAALDVDYAGVYNGQRHFVRLNILAFLNQNLRYVAVPRRFDCGVFVAARFAVYLRLRRFHRRIPQRDLHFAAVVKPPQGIVRVVQLRLRQRDLPAPGGDLLRVGIHERVQRFGGGIALRLRHCQLLAPALHFCGVGIVQVVEVSHRGVIVGLRLVVLRLQPRRADAAIREAVKGLLRVGARLLRPRERLFRRRQAAVVFRLRR